MSETAADTIRVAQFNASLNRFAEGQLITDLSTPNNRQAQTVAEIVQRVAPDVLLINEFDFDAGGIAAGLFRDNYLEVAQNTLGLAVPGMPIEYPYVHVAPSNTGIPSGFDLNNNGSVGGPDDALGFGFFPGQFGMLILSKYEIVEEGIRTFQEFLWADMPGARLPDDAATLEAGDFYSDPELDIFRVSSKSHWDIPILVDGKVVHILASHPTPPVFDGPEDRNGLRNADEIRLSGDYVTPGAGDYIYDDNGNTGGLGGRERFVLLGDQNSDPFDGDSLPNAAQQLLDNPLFDTSITPTSAGGAQQATLQGGANTTHDGDPANDTADFADGAPGNLRADYALPSAYGLTLEDAGIFWPLNTDPLFPLVGLFNPALPGGFPSSDHKLIWVDVAIIDEPELAFDLPATGAATAFVYTATNAAGTLRSDAADDVTGDTLNTFAAAYGDIAITAVEYADGTIAGAPEIATLTWSGTSARLADAQPGFLETARITAFTGTALIVDGFDTVAIELAAATDGLTLVIAGAERGLVETGSGDDSITLDPDAQPRAGGFRLFGGEGADSLTGGAGRERLNGGDDADILTGGDGADVFILSASGATGDILVDFDAAAGDLILFRGFGGSQTIDIDGTEWTVTGANGRVVTFDVFSG